jgi:hypothetical protein
MIAALNYNKIYMTPNYDEHTNYDNWIKNVCKYPLQVIYPSFGKLAFSKNSNKITELIIIFR